VAGSELVSKLGAWAVQACASLMQALQQAVQGAGEGGSGTATASQESSTVAAGGVGGSLLPR